MTIDTSSTRTGYVDTEKAEDEGEHAIMFKARVLIERQQGYAQVKRVFWGIVSTMKVYKDYT